jgi:hypothetical protein
MNLVFGTQGRTVELLFRKWARRQYLFLVTLQVGSILIRQLSVELVRQGLAALS